MPSSLYFLWSPIKGSRRTLWMFVVVDCLRGAIWERKRIDRKLCENRKAKKNESGNEITSELINALAMGWDVMNECGLLRHWWTMNSWINVTAFAYECLSLPVCFSLFYGSVLYIGKYTAQTKHKKSVVQNIILFCLRFSSCSERASVYWGQPEWRRKSEHDDESSWLCHSFFRSRFGLTLLGCFSSSHIIAHTRECEKSCLSDFIQFTWYEEDDDERIVDSTLKLT